MENKVYLKKYITISIIISIVLIIIFILINVFEYRLYTKNVNNTISSIVGNVLENYPEVTEEELMNILNTPNTNSDIFTKYGIDINKDSIILSNTNYLYIFIITNTIFIILLIIILVTIFLKYNKHKDRELNNITNYLNKLNNYDYDISIDSLSEDDLSILKSEVYKTTVMLKTERDNSLSDKLSLKDSLSDISHQLKTPLTSITVLIDNILDSNIDDNTRYEFIKDIKREVNNMNYLVSSILTLSKFDANSIKYIKTKENMLDIINKSIDNVSIIKELKNITIDIDCSNTYLVNCDIYWEVQAITNILKNAIEYSSFNDTIYINVQDNKVYTLLEIKNKGTIDSNDLPHIFERFYKGANSSSDSVGIGLALAKSIILHDNGDISVECNENFTIFSVKYYK